MSDGPAEVRLPRQIPIILDGDEPLPSPEGVNFFHLTVGGTEVQLLVGWVSLLRIAEIESEHKEAKVQAQITHNFLMSIEGLARLKATLDNLLKKRPGLLDKFPAPPEPQT